MVAAPPSYKKWRKQNELSLKGDVIKQNRWTLRYKTNEIFYVITHVFFTQQNKWN